VFHVIDDLQGHEDVELRRFNCAKIGDRELESFILSSFGHFKSQGAQRPIPRSAHLVPSFLEAASTPHQPRTQLRQPSLDENSYAEEIENMFSLPCRIFYVPRWVFSKVVAINVRIVGGVIDA